MLLEDPIRREVACGRVFKLAATLHNRPLSNDEVRVVVDTIYDPHAVVPVPTDEVTTVGEALQQFISWPKNLVELLTDHEVRM